MKIIILLVYSMLFCVGAKAQRNKDVFTFYDIDGKKTTDDDKSAYFTRLKYRNDTTWRLDVYDLAGPLINSITFSDRTTKNKNGVFSSYHPNGMLESTGDFKNNQKNGTWLYCDTAGKYVSQREFMNGVVTDSIDLTAPKPQPISNDTSKTFTRVERESFFKGGQKDWTKYLTKNLNYHPAAIKANISGRVTVIFIVDKLGKATEARLFQSTHFYLDDEALRLIENSPKWTPAEQDGRIVKSYKLQPIIFRFE